jgi:RNA polymerase sigma-70 factor (ECF subfamily)
MNAPPEFKGELLALLPSLRAYARSLARDRDGSDDLVQETITKAWAKHASFSPGTNMRAWLFTIMRNAFYSGIRRRRRETEDVDGAAAARMAQPPTQVPHIELEEFKAALEEIKPQQREALILIGVAGCTYEEAAEICQCAVGTVKSRVNRARQALAAKLGSEQPASFETAMIAGGLVKAR